MENFIIECLSVPKKILKSLSNIESDILSFSLNRQPSENQILEASIIKNENSEFLKVDVTNDVVLFWMLKRGEILDYDFYEFMEKIFFPLENGNDKICLEILFKNKLHQKRFKVLYFPGKNIVFPPIPRGRYIVPKPINHCEFEIFDGSKIDITDKIIPYLGPKSDFFNGKFIPKFWFLSYMVSVSGVPKKANFMHKNFNGGVEKIFSIKTL